MTTPQPDPPLAPDELVSVGSEREVLEAFLDLYRDVLKRKLGGLSDEQIRQRHVPSQTTLGGLIKHLTAVEREWFQVILESVPYPRIGRVSLRWIYVHMIEESARHVGHADILREQTDGATGFDGLRLTREPGMPRRARRHGMVVATNPLFRAECRFLARIARPRLGAWAPGPVYGTRVPRRSFPRSEVAGQERLQCGAQLGGERERLVVVRGVLGDVLLEEVVDPVEVHVVEPG